MTQLMFSRFSGRGGEAYSDFMRWIYELRRQARLAICDLGYHKRWKVWYEGDMFVWHHCEDCGYREGVAKKVMAARDDWCKGKASRSLAR